VRLFIYESCSFLGVNNFGGLQSRLDLNGLEFSTEMAPFVPNVPPLEPIQIGIVYANAEQDTITNLARYQANDRTIYIAKFVSSASSSLPIERAP
jgi:hypothetical protein